MEYVKTIMSIWLFETYTNIKKIGSVSIIPKLIDG